MKKIRIFLAVSAVLMAFGGAAASRYIANNSYYEDQGLEGCAERVVSFTCSTNNTEVICATAEAPSIQLKQDPNTSTSCGPVVWRQP